jgi:hypothetical protein
MELVTNGYAYALLTVAHAEGTAEINLLTDIVLCNEMLKLLYYLTGALDVTGATYTYCDFKHLLVSVSFLFVLRRVYPRRILVFLSIKVCIFVQISQLFIVNCNNRLQCLMHTLCILVSGF